ncbi:MAG TPA: amidohydrolase family protein [Chloroflexota bacterium]
MSMSYQGQIVIDADCHMREYADLDRTYREHMDPGFRDAYEELSQAVSARQRWPGEQVLFMNPRSFLAPTPERRPLGVRDSFAIVPSGGNGGRRTSPTGAEAPGSSAARIDPACNWDPALRLRDMDAASIDIGVMFSSQSDGFCVLRDIGFEHALHQAYHRYMTNYCSESEGRLRWISNSTLRDIPTTISDLTYWAQQDDNFAGMFIPRACPDGRLLDNPDLHPLYAAAQDLDLPLWVHGGTLRPPLTPGATDLDDSGFLIQAMYHGWGGQTAVGALIGGGVFDLFPRLRIGVFESGAGWMPWLIERLDEAYRPRSGMTPNLRRKPSEVIAEGHLFCSVEPGEEHLAYCVDTLGEDIWLFSTGYPHPGTCWPDGVSLIDGNEGLSEQAKLKILSQNAQRLCPRLAK